MRIRIKLKYGPTVINLVFATLGLEERPVGLPSSALLVFQLCCVVLNINYFPNKLTIVYTMYQRCDQPAGNIVI